MIGEAHYLIARVLLFIFALVYRVRDQSLSHALHEFAARYQRRAYESWVSPDDSVCPLCWESAVRSRVQWQCTACGGGNSQWPIEK